MVYRHNYTSLFYDPHITYPINDVNVSFADYINQCRDIIRHTRADLQQSSQSELIIDANSPYELIPEKPIFSTQQPGKIRSGALLAHGLFDCPFLLKDLGKHLQSQGLLVRSVLLPGHGTIPGGLLHVRYQDWIQAMHYGLNSLAKEVEQIFIVGYSTGGALALYQALQQSSVAAEPRSRLAGLILLSPAIQLCTTFGFLAGWPPLFRKYWLRTADEIDYTRYQSITFNSVYQIYQLTKIIQSIHHNQHALPCPIFVSISQNDLTVSSPATLDYFQRYACANSQLLLYTDRQTTHQDPRIIIRPSAYPHYEVSDISHTAIPIDPDNPHYGRQGDFIAARKKAKNSWVLSSLFYRSTFNPDFAFLLQAIDQFIL